MMQQESSLEEIVAQLVTTVDPAGTATDIADVVAQRA
jgi:hypothetical protein